MSRLTIPAILASHPPFNFARLLVYAGWEAFPICRIAYAVELVAAACITWQLRSAVAVWDAECVVSRRPVRRQPTLHGFRARMERPWTDWNLHRLFASCVGASSAGAFVQFSLQMLWDPVGWEVDHVVSLPLPVMLAGLLLVAGIATVFHAAAQASITSIVVLTQNARVARRSRDLRISNGEGALRVWGDARELRWLTEQIATIRGDGTARDVPAALLRAREAISE